MGPLRGRSIEDGVNDLAGLTSSTSRGSSPPRHARRKAARTCRRPEITVSQPATRKITEWDEYTGRFDAVEAVEIRARVSGYLEAVNFTDGEEVKAGDLLFEIDPRPFERALEQAKAQLSEAKVHVSNASLDVERGRPLLKNDYISKKTFDDRENIVREAEAAVKVAEARVKTAELDLSFCRVTAPISGRMSRTLVTKGNFVSGGGTNGANTILTTIVTQDPIYIYFDISENNALKYTRLTEAGGKGAAGHAGRGSRRRPARRDGLPARRPARLRRQSSRPGHRHVARARRHPQQGRHSSRPACSHACAFRARPNIRRCCCPTRQSAPTRPTASSTSSATTTSPFAAPSSSAR